MSHVSPNSSAARRSTVLSIAGRLAQYLVVHARADPELATTTRGGTPIGIASIRGHQQIVDWLSSHVRSCGHCAWHLLICTWTGGEERQLDTGEDASDSVTRATIEKARRTVQKTRFYAQDSLGSRAGTFSENTAHVKVHAMKCRRVSLQLIRKQNSSREKGKKDPLVADTRMYHTL